MRHRHERQHDEEPDDELVIDLTERLAPYGAASEAPPRREGAPEGVVPTHAAILAAMVDQAPPTTAAADRAGAGGR